MAGDAPADGLVMLDRTRLRNLMFVVGQAGGSLTRARQTAEELLELAGPAGGAGVFESVRSLDSVAAWCRLQEGDIKRRLARIEPVAGDDLDHRSPLKIPLELASGYDGRQMGLLFAWAIRTGFAPTPDDFETWMAEIRANKRDPKYVEALFDELGGSDAAKLAPMILSLHLEAAGLTVDPAHPQSVDPHVLEAAMDQLEPFNDALMYALSRVGLSGGVDETFVKDLAEASSGSVGTGNDPPRDPKELNALVGRIQKEIDALQDTADGAGLVLSVLQPVANALGETKPLANNRTVADSVVVLRRGGKFLGVVSIGMLLSDLGEADGGEKVGVAAQVALSVVSTFVPGPVGWAATAALVMIWLFSMSDHDLPPAVDTKRYFDEGRPEGTTRSGGQNSYMEESGVPVPAP